MSNENEKIVLGATYQEGFAFAFLGQIMSHGPRFFEELHAKLNDWTPFLLSHEWFNEKEERKEFFSLMCIIDDLASVTRTLNNEELKTELDNVMKYLQFKKSSHAES